LNINRQYLAVFPQVISKCALQEEELWERKLNVQFPLDLLKSAEAYSLPEKGSIRKCKIFILFPGVPFSCFGFRVIFKKIFNGGNR